MILKVCYFKEISFRKYQLSRDQLLRRFIFTDPVLSYSEWIYFLGWRNLHNFAWTNFRGCQIYNVYDDSVKPATFSKIPEDVLTKSVQFVLICNLKHDKYFQWMYFYGYKNIANSTETIFRRYGWKVQIPQKLVSSS